MRASTTVTCAPAWTAARALSNPAGPPPATTTCAAAAAAAAAGAAAVAEAGGGPFDTDDDIADEDEDEDENGEEVAVARTPTKAVRRRAKYLSRATRLLLRYDKNDSVHTWRLLLFVLAGL